MFTVYETSPRYCHVTDALIGVIYHPLATVATRAEARALAAQWAETAMEERGLCLRDASGASVGFADPAPPAPPAPAADDDLPF